MSRVFIVGAKRTPIGSFNGALKSVTAAHLGAVAIKEAMTQSMVPKYAIDEVILGNVVGAGQGMGPGRQAAIYADIPKEVPAYSLNMVCGSGMKTVMNGAALIKSGDADIVVAAGAESMSNIPFGIDSKVRNGHRIGHLGMSDLLIKDGLTDVFNDYHMGITAENVVDQAGLTREQQDLFSLQSQLKAIEAIKHNKFIDEISPVTIKNRNGDNVVTTDEYPKTDITIQGLRKLHPAFKKEGSVTAGNSSGINDGASAIVLASEAAIKKHGLTPLAEIVSYAQAGVDPEFMGLGPVPAILKALSKADLNIGSVDLFELNEAFAGQALAVLHGIAKETNSQVEQLIECTNVNGGGIALGHPLGSSGNRIIVTLLYEMIRRGNKYGVASLCIGGGMGTALVIKNMI